MEKIASKEYHVHVSLFGQTHQLMEALPAVIAPYRISLVVPDMVVGRYKDADCFRVYADQPIELEWLL